MTLKELEIGDVFRHAKGKISTLFRVIDKPVFNIRHGSPTRKCLNLTTDDVESKSCRLEVLLHQKFINK